jgi:hypothetical protein
MQDEGDFVRAAPGRRGGEGHDKHTWHSSIDCFRFISSVPGHSQTTILVKVLVRASDTAARNVLYIAHIDMVILQICVLSYSTLLLQYGPQNLGGKEINSC